jgi:hypothetical protein
VSDDAAGWTAHLHAERWEPVACRLSQVAVQGTGPSTVAGGQALGAWAQRIAARVTSLAEPLHTVEIDQGRGEALLRSDPIQVDGDAEYFEVLLVGPNQATIRRYRGHHQPGKGRQQIPFSLTHEAIAKLVADLTAC